MLTTTAPSTCFRLSSPGQGIAQHRLGAYRHGLTGQIHILTAEEQTAFESHCQGIREALAPVGALEINPPGPSPKTAGASNPPAPSNPASSPPASNAPAAFSEPRQLPQSPAISGSPKPGTTSKNVRKAGIQMPAAA